MKGFEGAYGDLMVLAIDMILDKENMDRLIASKSREKARMLRVGTRVRFVRKFNTGRDWDSGSPVVVKSDGTTWDMDVTVSLVMALQLQ